MSRHLQRHNNKRNLRWQSVDAVIAAILFLVSMPIRFQNLEFPSQIVFDEVHFGQYVSDYFSRSFFFDIHPPLAKLMLAAVAWATGYRGEFEFDHVGSEYTEHVPYLAMRGLGATLGALVVPLAYQTTRDIGCSRMAAILASLAICFDNGYITNHRFILLDSYLIFFIAFSVFAWIRFCKQVDFSRRWWHWLFLTGVGLGCAISTKWIGLFTLVFILLCASKQLWESLGNLQLSKRRLTVHFLARSTCLLGVPFMVYLATFYIHFSILIHSGSGDAHMPFETQNELKGIPALDAPLDITYGSLITMRHLNTMGGYLHSHPVNYPEGSYQQQVTLYPFKDENNWWRILKANETRPMLQDVLADDQQTWLEYVRHGDLVRLEHVKTAPRKLHSHDFSAPITDSDYHHEVSAYGYQDHEGDSNDFWQVQIESDTGSKGRLEARHSRFRLFHTNQKCHLYSTVQRLPEWGYFQQEVSCIVDGLKETALWSIIDASNPMLPKSSKMIPEHRPGFLEKFVYANKAMASLHQELSPDPDDMFSPLQWPFLLSSRYLFIEDAFQFILLGNPFGYWASTTAVLISILLFSLSSLLYKRYSYSSRSIHLYQQTAGFFVAAWAVHYIPFLRMERQLSPHHYMAALYFALLALGALFDLLMKRIPCLVRMTLLVVIVSTVVYYYCLLFPVTYGTEWTVDECQQATLLSSWDINCLVYQPHHPVSDLIQDTAKYKLIETQEEEEIQDEEEEEEYSDDEEEEEMLDVPTDAPFISEPEPEFVDGKEVFPEEDEDEDDYWPKTTYGVDPDDWENPSPLQTRAIPITSYRI